jgi:4-hydroxybenzoate polyprenyltransferase
MGPPIASPVRSGPFARARNLPARGNPVATQLNAQAFRVRTALEATRKRLGLYARLVRLDRPIGALLLLWPTLWALWLAGHGHPDPWILFVFVAGVWLMRGAGCAVNDFADRNFDPYVARTRHRPLAQRDLKGREAWAIALVLVGIASLLVFTLNRLTVLLAAVALLLTVSYPFLKRFTHLPQPYLGVAFGWGIPMAWAAETGRIPTVAWLLLLANVLWTTVYDTFYAMADRPWDRQLGIKSTALLFGDYDLIVIAGLQALTLLAFLLVGHRLHLNGFYEAGVATAGVLFLVQLNRARERNPEQCFRSFLNNNWVGLSIFLGIALNYILRLTPVR